MTFDLPRSKKTVVLKDFIPHGVHAKVQAALTRNMKIDPTMLNPTKEQLLQEFGADEFAKLNELPQADYEKRLVEMRSDFVRRNIKIESLSLENAEEANMHRCVGMVESLDGKAPYKDDINNLPEEDVQEILRKINEIENAPLDSAAPSAN